MHLLSVGAFDIAIISYFSKFRAFEQNIFCGLHGLVVPLALPLILPFNCDDKPQQNNNSNKTARAIEFDILFSENYILNT